MPRIWTTYVQQRDGNGRVEIKARTSARPASLLGWRKPPGPAGVASATIICSSTTRSAGVRDIDARGPGPVDLVARPR